MCRSEEFVTLTFRTDNLPESKIELPEDELKNDESKLDKSKEDYRQG